ncbi:branched-chain amino acid ABC transporter substrate-binding protein [Noviherbaspirillum cavernae]|uniref:Branched-chain amino acid ABC transporter substrate-binding protein n=1 Tax=Noviherbaspirillum cavernae TaxID=2320862 RepID=A0A418X3C1_9BURK|nr:ABC transporter substrate-binding protein [Noviherbaspirillum cavernae]RJG06968.1 branched-chain amino acid ABC transporter substrate-binding protein [Noviherbaspirillum cavernae]
MIQSHRKQLLTTAAICAALAAPTAFADIKIGFNAPLTGFAAADGKSSLEGAKLAVAQANAKGGINGEKIELVVYDDQASPKEAVPVATKLVEKDKVVGAVSGSYSGSTRAAAGIFQQAKVPYVTAYALHPDITLTGDYMFRSSTMGEVQGRAGAQLVQNLGKKKAALITLKNDFGQALAAGFKEGAGKFGVQVVSEYEYGIQDRQFGALVSKVKSDNPDVIYATGYYFNAGPLVSQLRAAGVTVPVIGQEGYDSDKFIEIAGAAAEGVYVTTSLDRDSESPVTKSFIAEFRKSAGFNADMVAASAYTATSVLIESLKKSGGKGGEALKNALAAGTFETPIGKLAFNDLHEVKKDVQVQIVKDKAFRRHSVITGPLVTPPSKAGK